MFPQLTLDQQSFEQLLSAASLIQQLSQQRRQASTPDLDDGRTLSAMVETQQAIETGALDLDSAIGRVVDLALKLTGARGAAMWLFTPHGFLYRAGAGSAVEDERLRLEVLSRLAAIDGLGDGSFLDLSALWSPVPDAAQPISVKSLVIAPIYQGHKIAGGLAVFSTLPDVFTEQDRTNSRLLAGILAHALAKSAETELKQSVSSERATVLQVIDQLIPALAKLAELAGRDEHIAAQPLSPSRFPITTKPKAVEVNVAVPELVIPQEILEQVVARTTTANAERPAPATAQPDIDTTPSPLWQGQDEPPRDMHVPEFVPPSPPAVQPVAFTSALAKAKVSASLQQLRPLASKAQQRSAELLAATRSLAASGAYRSQVSLVAARQALARSSRALSVSATTSAKRHLQQLRPKSANALARLEAILQSIANYQVRVRIVGGPNGRYPLALAGAGTVLMVMAFFLVLTTGMIRSSSSIHSREEARLNTSTVPQTNAATKSVKLTRDPGSRATTTRQPSPTVDPTSAPALQSSHLQVTDRNAESELRSLSPFEIGTLRRQAGYGDDNAAFLLGMAYETGHGLPRSCSKAREWVAKSASQGNAAAQYNLALRYRDGDGVPANPDEAQKWFEKASAHKYSEARLAHPQLATNGHAM